MIPLTVLKWNPLGAMLGYSNIAEALVPLIYASLPVDGDASQFE